MFNLRAYIARLCSPVGNVLIGLLCQFVAEVLFSTVDQSGMQKNFGYWVHRFRVARQPLIKLKSFLLLLTVVIQASKLTPMVEEPDPFNLLLFFKEI